MFLLDAGASVETPSANTVPMIVMLPEIEECFWDSHLVSKLTLRWILAEPCIYRLVQSHEGVVPQDFFKAPSDAGRKPSVSTDNTCMYIRSRVSMSYSVDKRQLFMLDAWSHHNSPGSQSTTALWNPPSQRSLVFCILFKPGKIGEGGMWAVSCIMQFQ